MLKAAASATLMPSTAAERIPPAQPEPSSTGKSPRVLPVWRSPAVGGAGNLVAPAHSRDLRVGVGCGGSRFQIADVDLNA